MIMEPSDSEGHLDLNMMDRHGMGGSTVSVEVVDPNTFEYTFPVTDDSLPVESHFEVVSDLGGGNEQQLQQNASLIVVNAQDCQSEDLQHQIELVLQAVQPEADGSMQQIAMSTITEVAPEAESTEVEIVQEETEQVLPSKSKQERNKRSVPSQWKRNSNKMKRMKGQEYMGYQAVAEDYGDKVQTRFTEAQLKGSRVLGPPCMKHFSTSSKGFQCHSLTEEERKGLFHNFWNNMDWELKRLYISLSIEVDCTKRHTTSSGDQSKRQESWRYFIRKSPAESVRVCKEMFLSTFGVGTGMVRYWVKNNNITAPVSSTAPAEDPEVSKRITATEFSEESHAIEFVRSLPRLKEGSIGATSKHYLEPNLTSKIQIYNLYRTRCEEEIRKPVNRATFYKIFSNSDVHLLPKKDGSCSTCKLYDDNQIPPEEGRDHLNHEFLLRRELKQDKDHATTGRACVLMVAMDHVRQSPRFEAKNADAAAKSKLNVHNMIIYDLKTAGVTCMWWNEVNGELNPSTYASCIRHYLETVCTEKIPVIIYSDVESGFNKNVIVANALLDYANKHGKIVTQKFAEKGHKLPDCDNIRRSIDKVVKGQDIYLPSDYERAMKAARKKPSPYNIWCISYDFFKDYSFSEKGKYSTLNIFGADQAYCPVAENIRSLKYLPSGIINFKTNLSDQWTAHPLTPKPVMDDLHWPCLYSQPLKLTESKWRDLQDLKLLLPMDCRSFYDTLPH